MTQGNYDIKVMPQKLFLYEFVGYLIPDSSPDETNLATQIKSNRTQA